MTRRPMLRGVSIIEVLVSLAIVGILLGVAWPTLADMLSRRRVEAVASELRSNLAFARSEAGLRARILDVWFNRNQAMSCYTVAMSVGALGNCDCTRAPTQACSFQQTESKTVQVLTSETGVLLTPQPGDRLRFLGPQLTPQPDNFAVLVQGRRVGQLLISMNPLGRISTCSPDQSMPGVASC